mmetsp:Transcript_27237/g.35720  ORF Transcript_27237/g.35720 Transcript_27237/m.35720 type:complete len:212 (+) Transcript_27237:151-786(+)|eukprot:CAMPEP_0117752602 /NCGR_PEP_ID=MMETSP0947-20121206/11715_1 /TAXON_ID=44440 /ORGANISM="Chattonella subsalsa, Strain CCMP2191" /LENGTH=211 /DNA_ID=CAMNT_0005571299 /DNA_START=131 /DNA_END=766 /DNA_ORIENTATION=-
MSSSRKNQKKKKATTEQVPSAPSSTNVEEGFQIGQTLAYKAKPMDHPTKVTLLSKYFDGGETFYTIKMPDGREKETVASKLSVPPSAQNNAAKAKEPEKPPPTEDHEIEEVLLALPKMLAQAEDESLLDFIENQLEQAKAQVKETREEKHRLKEKAELEGLCIVCAESRKSVLLMPCKHICVCGECAQEESFITCPECHDPVEEKIFNIFL